MFMLALTDLTLFVDLPLGTVWAEWLARHKEPILQHPEGRRWGWCWDEGELSLYLGRLHAVLTPRRTLLALRTLRSAA